MADLAQMNQALRHSFKCGVNKSYEQRVKNLKLIKAAIETYYDEGSLTPLATSSLMFFSFGMRLVPMRIFSAQRARPSARI